MDIERKYYFYIYASQINTNLTYLAELCRPCLSKSDAAATTGGLRYTGSDLGDVLLGSLRVGKAKYGVYYSLLLTRPNLGIPLKPDPHPLSYRRINIAIKCENEPRPTKIPKLPHIQTLSMFNFPRL